MASEKLSALALAALLAMVTLVPFSASAYLLPEEVLMGNDLYVPPSRRETDARVRDQAARSADRREAEFAAEYERQHPSAPEEPVVEEAVEESGSSIDLEDRDILKTIRLLERIEARQELIHISNLQASAAPHGGAPLAPTGAGGVATLVVMSGATLLTLGRAAKTRRVWKTRRV